MSSSHSRLCVLRASLLVAMLAVMPACASDSSEKRAVELLQEGIEAGRAGDLDRAAELLEEAAETRPGFVDPLMFLANVEERRGNVPAARQAYERALQADPTFTDAGVAVASTYVSERRFDMADAWLRRCIDVDPGCDAALFNLGALAEQHGDEATAIAWYRLAGVINLWETAPLLQEGDLHLRAGRIEEAQRLADRALAREPDDPGVRAFAAAVKSAASQ